MKKASQSSQSAWAGSEEVVTELIRSAAVSAGVGVEEWFLGVRRDWIGLEKGFGRLLPGTSNIVVIIDEVEVGNGGLWWIFSQSWTSFTRLATISGPNSGYFRHQLP